MKANHKHERLDTTLGSRVELAGAQGVARATFSDLLREDFDEATFGASRVEWPGEREAAEQRVLSPTSLPAAQPSG